MSDIQQLPSRAAFIRDRLADYLDGLGHHVVLADERDGFPCLTAESSDGGSHEDIAVTADGRFMSMLDGWKPVRLRGFAWEPEPTDTGTQHRPTTGAYPANYGHGTHSHDPRGCAYCGSIVFGGPGL